MFHDVLEEFTATDIFHYHEYICRSTDDLIPTTSINKHLQQICTNQRKTWSNDAPRFDNLMSRKGEIYGWMERRLVVAIQRDDT